MVAGMLHTREVEGSILGCGTFLLTLPNIIFYTFIFKRILSFSNGSGELVTLTRERRSERVSYFN